MSVVEKDIKRVCGNEEVNLNSNREVADMFEQLGVSWRWLTPTGEYNTSKSVLKTIRDEYSSQEGITYIVDALLKYRKIEKIVSTYLDNKEDEIHSDGKVHPSYWVIGNDYGVGGTVTGRLSSSNPNMQNIPKGDIEIDGVKYNMRKYFVADDNYVIVSMDADQQEYRLLAHYGKDKTFMDFIHEGKDIHKATASMLFDIPYDDVDKPTRSKAKTLNFGLVYGLGNASFAKALGYDLDEDIYRKATSYLYKKYQPWKIPPYKDVATQPIIDLTSGELREAVEYFLSDEVQKIIKEVVAIKKSYFSRFPGINKFLKDCKKVAERRGYVKTWIGRRRHFKKPKKEGYKAPNAVIQGGCSDILKIKLIECNEFLNDKKSCIINNVHDQIDFMIHKDEIDIVPELNKILAGTNFRVPISWGIEYGKSLGDAIPTTLDNCIDDINKYII
jgi:DNA polymerase-1